MTEKIKKSIETITSTIQIEQLSGFVEGCDTEQGEVQSEILFVSITHEIVNRFKAKTIKSF
ncbi:MAG TPA: hypothetical protein VE544_03140 [Nitrososphaeraceae archaeon]|nr:hypothetical protein [Nitrososphaeraceae archaeon]